MNLTFSVYKQKGRTSIWGITQTKNGGEISKQKKGAFQYFVIAIRQLARDEPAPLLTF